MANTIYTADAVARLGVALVAKDLVLGATVNRDYEADFGGGRGDTVNVRVPAALSARTRDLDATAAITIDDVTESSQPVTLTNHVYSAVRVDDADLELNLEDFGRQVLAPQTLSVVEYLEGMIVTEMQSVAQHASITWGADPLATVVDARKALRDLGVPQDGNLFAAVGTELAADLLKSDELRRVDASGDNGALRDAVIGRIGGFTIIESNRLAEDEAVFYHRAAFTLAVRAPRVPEGVNFGQSIASSGFAMRYIRDYDASTLADRSVVSTFAGTATMPLKKAAGTFTPAIRIGGSAS